MPCNLSSCRVSDVKSATNFCLGAKPSKSSRISSYSSNFDVSANPLSTIQQLVHHADLPNVDVAYANTLRKFHLFRFQNLASQIVTKQLIQL